MENLINRILEIDEDAKKKLDNAYKKKSDILCAAEKQEDQIKEDVLKRVNGRVEKVEEFEQSNADEKLAELAKKTAEEISALDNTYNENHDKWEDEICRNIIPS